MVVRFLVSSSQSKSSGLAAAASGAVSGKAVNSFKKAIKNNQDSEDAKPLVASKNGR